MPPTPRTPPSKPPTKPPSTQGTKLVPMRVAPSGATSLAEVFEALARDLTPEGRRRMAEDFMHYLRTREAEEAT